MSSRTRRYRSPLRDAQGEQTRALILETMAAMLAAGRGEELSVRRLADEAQVSERTVYRYFPDRAALLDGLAAHVGELLGTGVAELAIETADDIAALVPGVFERFDQLPDVTKAEILVNPDPADRTDDQRQRTERFATAIDRTFPGLDPGERRLLTAYVRTLVSSQTWLRMREEFGIAGREAGELVARSLRLLFDDVRARGSARAADPGPATR